MKKRILALLMALAMLTVLLAGCGSSDSTSESSSETTEETTEAETEEETEEEEEAAEESEEAAAEETAETEEAEEAAEAEEEEASASTITYPLSGDDLTLTIWTSFPSNLVNYMESFSDHAGFQQAEEATGVHIEFTEIGMDNASTQFSLMAASESWTDIVLGFEDLYTGGLTTAYDEDVIYRLNDVVAEYAPDYYAVLSSSEDYEQLAYEVNGDLLAVFSFYEYDESLVTNGTMIRKDWLDNVGLDLPTTYDDWYEVMTAFKNEYDCSAAFLMPEEIQSSGSPYTAGYETAGYSPDSRMSGGHFYQVDGVVTSSLIDDNYRDWLIMVNQWYEEGLIYSDFYSADSRTITEELVLNNEAGIFSGKVDYISLYEEQDTTGEMELVGISNPLMEDGDVFGFADYITEKGSACITTACDDLELALNWLNYFFTDEGILLANWGEEGVSYTLNADGEPEFTDLIVANEELDYGNISRLYLLDEVLPTVYDQTRELVSYDDNEVAAIELWSSNREAIYTLPSLTLDLETNEEYSALLADIETYASECVVKFITGDMDIETEWDAFVETMHSMDIDRCIEIQQEALDAYWGN